MTETYLYKCPTSGTWHQLTRPKLPKPVTKVVQAARDAAEAKADAEAEAEAEAAALTRFGRTFRTKQKIGF